MELLPADLEGDSQWSEWPLCPDCQLNRQAECPVCGTAGTNFPLAELITAAPLIQISRSPKSEEPEITSSVDEVLLMCETCDEAFRPHFYRFCHACGHDFGEGIEPRIPHENKEGNPRVMLVLFALAALSCFTVGYVWFVLR